MNRYSWRTGVLEILMIATGVIFFIPLYILVNLAVRGPGDATPAIAPTRHPTLVNFTTAWSKSGMGSALLTSGVITVLSVVLIVACGALASYALVRSTARWSSPVFYLFLLGLLVPFQLTMIPMYQDFSRVHLVGKPLTLVIIYAGLRMPFTIFLYSSFLRSLPMDYEEAAALDGAGLLARFWRVVFPLMRPVTGAVVILNALFVWNDFFVPLLYLSSSSFSTVPLAIYSFVTDVGTKWSLVFAAMIVGILPVLVAFFLLQKSLIKGFSSGLKG
jgi:raffinose/stachyose/melibiose transport system permease protein